MKMMKVIFVMLVAVLSTALFARERIVLDMYDRVFNGDATIFLKREIQRMRPGLNLSRLELRSVRFIAKTRHGRGEAFLKVGHRTSYPEVVNGSPYDWNSNAPHTYDRVQFENPDRSSNGVWQIHMRGMFKVQRVVLVVERGYNPVPTNQRVTLNFRGRIFHGQGTLMLQREIQMQRPGINLRDFELRSVTLVAKSRHGMGRATLRVGHQTSMDQILRGNPYDFMSEAPYTYDTVRFNSPAYSSSMGPWQILLRGNIKVRRVDVVLVRKFGPTPQPIPPRPPRPPRPYMR